MRFAMGIGADADHETLTAFLGNDEGRVFEAHEAREIKNFFRWVTMTVTTRSRSANPNSAVMIEPTDLDDFDFWRESRVARHTYSFGASVRGPLHQREARANEDAWLHAKGTYGVMAVVCDGLGSRPNARFGSQAACLAVKEAVLRWSQSQGAPLRYLSNLIEVLWRLRIHPLEPSSAATTCLLVLASRSGAWVLGGVGDGLVLARTGRVLAAA